MNNDSTRAVRPTLILATCCMSLLMVSMDVTIVNVALSSIRRDLHASVAELQWSIDGYTVVIASFLMLAGSTADRLGRKRTFQAGLGLFSLGSLLCSVAPTTKALIVFRMIQALGGAMLNPVAMSIIVNVFTDLKARARAIGVWGAVFGVSMAIGPVVGGFLTEHVGWRSIFWINVPIGVAAIILTSRYIPESRAPKARRIDPVGQILVIVALAAMTSGVIDGRRSGFGSPEIIASFTLAVVCLVGLVAYESRRPEPLLDLRFFRSPPFSAATLVAVISFAAFSGFLFVNSLYLQDARGLSPSRAGLYTLSTALAMVICAPLSGRLVGAGRARLALVVAGVAIAGGAAMLVGLEAGTTALHLVVAYAVFGVGMGMVNAPITNTAVSGMPRSMAGLAAAVASTSRQVGASLGVAIAGSIAGGGMSAHASAQANAAAFAEATHPVWWMMAASGVAIVTLGFASTGKRAQEKAKAVAFLLDPPAGAGRTNAEMGSALEAATMVHE